MAGLLGGLVMVVALAPLRLLLPPSQRSPLPHTLVSWRLACRSGIGLGDRYKKIGIAALGHFCYSAASGGVYALAVPHLADLGSWTGLFFGLGLWAISYLGWIPALGLLPPAAEQPAGRMAVMAVANAVHGISVGIGLAWLVRKGENR